MHLLMLLTLACAPKPPPGSESAVDEAVFIEIMENQPALMEAPFSAAQIREGMPVGVVIRIRMTSPKGVTESDWEVLESDAEGCTILYTTYAEDGTLLEEGEGRNTWAELESHAHFPAAQTTRSEGELETALGRYEVFTFVVTDGEQTSTFHFAKELPGAPILMVVTEGGVEVARMETLRRQLP